MYLCGRWTRPTKHAGLSVGAAVRDGVRGEHRDTKGEGTNLGEEP